MHRDQAASAIDHLVAYVQKRIQPARVEHARPWRCAELTRLVVRHWPCLHLRSVSSAGGKNHADNAHAMALLYAQVHEQWEARQGVGPLWEMVLGGTVRQVCEILLELWWSDQRWQDALCELARYAGEREPVE